MNRAHIQMQQRSVAKLAPVTLEETMNRERSLSFSGPQLRGRVVENVRDFSIPERTIVVNVGMSDAPVTGRPGKVLRPLSSTILQHAVIEKAERLVLLQLTETRNLGRIVFERGWERYWDILVEHLGPEGAAASGFPRQTPLWSSAQDTLGTVMFDPRFVTGQRTQPQDPEKFSVKVNLWFAPAGTDCAIHNRHDFIELHTQIHGLGRMQKFHAHDPRTLYEDTLMSPGYTTPEPFCEVTEDGQLTYPWHQYSSEGDCIWMAIEYHPA